VVEGAQGRDRAVRVGIWDPSVASRHLPVPGRIFAVLMKLTPTG
jgi:hypothetical protein